MKQFEVKVIDHTRAGFKEILVKRFARVVDALAQLPVQITSGPAGCNGVGFIQPDFGSFDTRHSLRA
jgi:hypothetical protein